MRLTDCFYGVYQTPFGDAVIVTADNFVIGLGFAENITPEGVVRDLLKATPYKALIRNQTATSAVAKQVFCSKAGAVSTFQKGTDLQQAVWQTLEEIPWGQTISYQELAKEVGAPRAVRAVANAVGANRISYLIPCHRVVRKNGDIGGYRWGNACKQKILAFEQNNACIANDSAPI